MLISVDAEGKPKSRKPEWLKKMESDKEETIGIIKSVIDICGETNDLTNNTSPNPHVCSACDFNTLSELNISMNSLKVQKPLMSNRANFVYSRTDAGNCISPGDLSIGSDSVFISETEDIDVNINYKFKRSFL